MPFYPTTINFSSQHLYNQNYEYAPISAVEAQRPLRRSEHHENGGMGLSDQQARLCFARPAADPRSSPFDDKKEYIVHCPHHH